MAGQDLDLLRILVGLAALIFVSGWFGISILAVVVSRWRTHRDNRRFARQKSSKVSSFTVSASSKDVLRVLLRDSLENRHMIDFLDEGAGTLITTEDPPYGLAAGFSYPIYVSALDADRVLVEVGIEFPFRGMRRRILDGFRERFVNRLRAAFLVAGMSLDQ